MIVLWKEEEKAKYAYDFTHGSKKERGGGEAPTQAPQVFTALLFNIFYAASHRSTSLIFNSSRIGDIYATKSSCSIILSYSQKEKKSYSALGLPLMKDILTKANFKTNFRGRTRCSSLNTLKLNTVRVLIHTAVYIYIAIRLRVTKSETGLGWKGP